jgi:hypothetical protein
MSDRSFAANLQRVGLVAAETETLLSAYATTADWGKVRELALRQNLLGKRTTTHTTEIVKAVARRYLRGPVWLPGPQSAAAFFVSPAVPSRAKHQVAFLYVLAEDVLASECLDALVATPPGSSAGGYLHLDDVLRFLGVLATEHPELERWQPYLRRRWSQGFCALLRDVGFMEKAPSFRLASPVILPEAFGFIFPWLVEATGSIRAALDHQVLGWWGLDGVEKNQLLAVGQNRGWWRYASAGSMIEFQPHRPAGETLTHALG